MIHIACASDTAYLPHCATMLHSVLCWHPGSVIHFLRDPRLNDDKLKSLAGMVSALGGDFHAHPVPPQWITDLPRISTIPELMWYRIYLPDLLRGLDKILYLDADTLVADDLTALWNTPLNGYYLAAVSNVMPGEAMEWPQSLGMEKPQDYFNSGVLLLNLELMRADGLPVKLAAFGRTPGRALKWPDQDALNALMWCRRKVLHPRWNCQNSLYLWPSSTYVFTPSQIREATRNPGILHFEGGHLAKPWHYLNRHPFRCSYIEHRQQTPWPHIEIEGRSLFHRLLRPLPTRWTIAVLKLKRRMQQRLQHMRARPTK